MFCESNSVLFPFQALMPKLGTARNHAHTSKTHSEFPAGRLRLSKRHSSENASPRQEDYNRALCLATRIALCICVCMCLCCAPGPQDHPKKKTQVPKKEPQGVQNTRFGFAAINLSEAASCQGGSFPVTSTPPLCN